MTHAEAPVSRRGALLLLERSAFQVKVNFLRRSVVLKYCMIQGRKTGVDKIYYVWLLKTTTCWLSCSNKSRQLEPAGSPWTLFHYYDADIDCVLLTNVLINCDITVLQQRNQVKEQTLFYQEFNLVFITLCTSFDWNWNKYMLKSWIFCSCHLFSLNYTSKWLSRITKLTKHYSIYYVVGHFNIWIAPGILL